MTTDTLRPDSTISSSGIVRTGGSTIHGVLADNSDGTYISGTLDPDISRYVGSVRLGFDTTPLPAGAVTKTIQIRVRATGGGFTIVVGGDVPGTTLNILSLSEATAPQAISWTQSQIDALQVTLDLLGDSVTLYEVYADLTYAEKPVALVSAPTGVVTTTSQPAITWSHTAGDDDGGPQSRYRVKVFSAAQYGAGGFNPQTSPATYDSGEQLGPATSATPTALPTAGTWRAYVRTAQTVNGQPQWSDWAFSAFTTSYTEPTIAAVAVTANTAQARFDVLVTRTVMSPTWIGCDVQRSTDGGATWVFVRGATNAPASGTTFAVTDYEAPFATSTLYRARAVSALITGPWLVATAATITPTTAWLKAVSVPSLNIPVCLRDAPTESYGITQGVNVVLGRDEPVVLSDVRRLAVGSFSVLTPDAATRAALLALMRTASVLLLQVPEAVGGVVELFFVAGQLDVARPSGGGKKSLPQRIHVIGYSEIRRPAEVT